MFSWLQYRWSVLRLAHDLRGARRLCARAERQARKEGLSTDKIFKLNHEWSAELGLITDELAKVKSRRILVLASRLSIPLPADDGSWVESYQTGARHLSSKGYAIVRADVRKERNEKWQFWEVRMKVLGVLLTAVTGAIGALIGLIAIWPKHLN
jgi:hypothetical protein